jgi:phage tail sheath protein FI
MTDYTYPGVYIQEVPSGPGPITGVSTSNLGLIGFSTKGPVNEPIISTSFQEFSNRFGSFTEKGLSAHEAFAFFSNGGQVLYFVRVVASDAATAYWDFAATVSSENVSNTAEGTGIYDLELDHSPVVPATLTLTFTNSGTPANQNVFVADASGVLTLDTTASGGSADGGTGSVDMETGEIHVELTTPGQFTGSTDYIVAEYNYTIFRFRMAWPGLAGNYFRVRIIPGSDDYLVQAEARWTRFTVIVEEDVNYDATNRSWSIVETWADLVFDDSEDPNFVATVINADGAGSDYIEVVDYGNGMNPAALAGTQITSEDISDTQLPQGSSSTPPVAYDGTTKAWEYTLANAPFQKTLNMDFQMADGLVSFTGAATADNVVLTDSGANFTGGGAADNLAGKIVVNISKGASAVITANTATTITGVLTGGAVTWLIGDLYAVIEASTKIGIGTADAGGEESVISPGNASNPVQIVPGSVVMELIIAGPATIHVIDDGSGNLWDGVSGKLATINYTTGQITGASPTTDDLITIQEVAAWSTAVTVVGSEIKFGCIYAVPIALEDDADGNMVMSDTQATGYPAKFSLNLVSGVNTVNYTTGVVDLTWKIEGNPVAGPAGVYSETTDYYTNPDDEIATVLTGGSDGSSVSSDDVVGADLAVDQEGIYAFGKVNALMQLVAADFQTDTNVADALITYAELVKDKFVILTVPHGLSYQEAVNWKKFQLNKYTSYAALYYPHIKIKDPVSGVNQDIPVGGHVAGVYARTDTIRNVGEAPAGTEKGVLNWSTGLEVELTDTQVGIIYPEKINALVAWANTGRVVWGARTLDISGGEWPYIQMRRLFMFVEKSVFNSTHLHVFKNNGSSLWSAIRTQVVSFLLGLHQSGYFAGNSPDESFFVICDRSNNPQNTVDQGIVFCDVGIAPNKPAEFIVFRFQQKALTS